MKNFKKLFSYYLLFISIFVFFSKESFSCSKTENIEEFITTILDYEKKKRDSFETLHTIGGVDNIVNAYIYVHDSKTRYLIYTQNYEVLKDQVSIAIQQYKKSKSVFNKFKKISKSDKEVAKHVIIGAWLQAQTAIDEGKESEDKISIKRMLESDLRVKTPVEEAMEIYRLKDFRD